MKQAPLVSIALCTYNGSAYLAAQLDTLVNQTYAPTEIIAVDDCSTDNTYAILEDFASRYPQFKIYKNETNLGFAANFEKAVKLCSGELIALCDQDDLWHPQKIELQAAAINDNVLIYHDSEFISQDGVPMGKKMSDIRNFYRGCRPEVFLIFNCVSGHSILMKRSLIDDALPLPKDYFHDWWLAYVATNVGSIDFTPECLVQYRQHQSSDTNILRLERKNDTYVFSAGQKIERLMKWFGYCAAFSKNRSPELIEDIYRAYTRLADSYISFWYSALLFRYRKTMLFIRKKGSLSNLNYIYSQVWGLKSKKLFSKK